MKTQNNIANKNNEDILKSYQPEFKVFFETRVMQKIANLKENSYNDIFDKAFRRIALSGVAALAILLLSIFITDGSLSTDALLGTSQIDFESLSALAISSY